MVEYYSRLVAAFELAQKEHKKAAIDFEGTMVDIAAYRRAVVLLSNS